MKLTIVLAQNLQIILLQTATNKCSVKITKKLRGDSGRIVPPIATI